MNILITGCSKGLGYGLSRFYLEGGHRVFGISRSGNDELENYPGFSHLGQDLSDFDSLRKNIPAFLGEIKTLDLAILNAGILNDIKDMRDTGLEEIRHVMDLNVWANKVLIDYLLDELDEILQIVAVSSGAAVSGSRGWNAYALSKATLNMLIDLYSRENENTHFIAMAPGLIDSGMQDYISGLPEEIDFPVVQKLKKAKGSEQMPPPERAAEIVADAIKKALNYESGSFVDVRQL
ncbi:MAG: SDR family NAD(P)-dependent oxidoreductase [Bacteroidales bacterium]|jgi:NAD(P)-dependent dehydrogenase (short-subunit alcohol dehydrogenase family)|nr:SDR family NAD(P)-dependent oxidoreductase [Bacteroidales bacterium]